MKKQVDIIIPIFNRPEHTRQTMESLLKNTDPNLYNLYLINDGSDAPTSQVVLDIMLGQKEVIALNKNNPQAIGPAKSRNEMCAYITKKGLRSKYLYHSDNDVYFIPNWLEKLLKAFKVLEDIDSLTKLLGGGCHPYLQNNRLVEFSEFNLGLKDAVSGYSQLMTWETWDKYGPFDEGQGAQEIKIMGSEDWAFCQRIIKDGFLVGSIEPEVVIHTGKTNTYGNPSTGSETFKQVEGVNIK